MSLQRRPRQVPADRYDVIGTAVCLVGVVVIRYAPRH
ncbi:hypothetical protein AB0K00_19920 [Dactylosporangium sp. NPDC049525]